MKTFLQLTLVVVLTLIVVPLVLGGMNSDFAKEWFVWVVGWGVLGGFVLLLLAAAFAVVFGDLSDRGRGASSEVRTRRDARRGD